MSGGFECNHGGAPREAASAGLGIVYLPLFYMADAVERGVLVTVLEKYCRTEIGILAVHRTASLVPPQMRACLDRLARELPARLASAPGGAR